MREIKNVKLPAAFLRCFVVAAFLAYGVMLIYWAVNDFKYGIEQCGKIVLYGFPLFFVLLVGIVGIIMLYKYITLVRLRKHRLYCGGDKKYFKLLKKYLGGLNSADSILYYCYRCAESGRYKECLKNLKKIDVRNLYGKYKMNFFNTVLLCGVLSGNKKLSEETYMRCSDFLYNGANYKGNEHFCLTLGIYSFSHKDYFWGENYFKAAAKSKNKDIRCNALLYLSRYYINMGEYGKSKSCIIGAGKCLCSLEQCKQMRKQMIEIQNIYRGKK